MSVIGEPAYRITLTRGLAMRLAGYAIVLLYVGGFVVSTIDLASSYRPDSAGSLLAAAAGALAVAVATLVAHEGVHGLFMRLFGATPRYGVGRMGWMMVYAYATAPGAPFTLRQMLVVCLAPLVVISTAALAIAWLVPAAGGFAAVAFLVNFSGAAGDLWMAARMLRFRTCRELVLADTMSGVDIHTPDPAAAAIAAELAKPAGVVERIVLRWFVACTVILFSLIPLGVLSMVTSTDVTVGPGQFALASFTPVPGGVEGWLNPYAVVVAGLFAALVSLIVVRRRRDTPESSLSSRPHPAFM
jgi:hypothetical protein